MCTCYSAELSYRKQRRAVLLISRQTSSLLCLFIRRLAYLKNHTSSFTKFSVHVTIAYTLTIEHGQRNNIEISKGVFTVHITISPYLTSFQLTSFYLNWSDSVRRGCDQWERSRSRSLHVKAVSESSDDPGDMTKTGRPSNKPTLIGRSHGELCRSMQPLSSDEMKSAEMRSDEVRFVISRLPQYLHALFLVVK